MELFLDMFYEPYTIQTAVTKQYYQRELMVGHVEQRIWYDKSAPHKAVFQERLKFVSKRGSEKDHQGHEVGFGMMPYKLTLYGAVLTENERDIQALFSEGHRLSDENIYSLSLSNAAYLLFKKFPCHRREVLRNLILHIPSINFMIDMVAYLESDEEDIIAELRNMKFEALILCQLSGKAELGKHIAKI